VLQIAAMNGEQWRSVVGYEGLYGVSSLGRVRSERDDRNTYFGRILSPGTNGPSGYLVVNLSRNNKQELRTVHGLVAEAFIGERPLGYEVNHRDGDKRNNADTNLEYVTSSRNKKHAAETGLLTFQKIPRADIPAIRERFKRETAEQIAADYGVTAAAIHNVTHHVRGNKLTPDDVRAIRAACAAGATQSEVARRYSVTRGMVGHIVRREAWPTI
jgi:uncharacterized protein (DUF433 family)